MSHGRKSRVCTHARVAIGGGGNSRRAAVRLVSILRARQGRQRGGEEVGVEVTVRVGGR